MKAEEEEEDNLKYHTEFVVAPTSLLHNNYEFCQINFLY